MILCQNIVSLLLALDSCSVNCTFPTCTVNGWDFSSVLHYQKILAITPVQIKTKVDDHYWLMVQCFRNIPFPQCMKRQNNRNIRILL